MFKPIHCFIHYLSISTTENTEINLLPAATLSALDEEVSSSTTNKNLSTTRVFPPLKTYCNRHLTKNR